MPLYVVSLNQDTCTSCGVCPEIAPSYFYLDENDGLARVADPPGTTQSPREHLGLADAVPVLDGDVDDVVEAVQSCPTECIEIDAV